MADEESNMLTLSIIVAGALVWISAIGQHVGNLLGVGAKWVMSDRSQSVGSDGFIGRSARTLRNNVESGAMYAPVAVMALFLHQSSPRKRAGTPRSTVQNASHVPIRRSNLVHVLHARRASDAKPRRDGFDDSWQSKKCRVRANGIARRILPTARLRRPHSHRIGQQRHRKRPRRPGVVRQALYRKSRSRAAPARRTAPQRIDARDPLSRRSARIRRLSNRCLIPAARRLAMTKVALVTGASSGIGEAIAVCARIPRHQSLWRGRSARPVRLAGNAYAQTVFM
jgi:hypothetical protein